jgi:hypothetical protein
VYWISSKTSVRWMTAPGEIARLSPSLNGLRSTTDGMPWFRTRSRARLVAPFQALRPPVS